MIRCKYNRDDTNIVITKADKGNCTVIIDKDKYEEKILNC